MKNSVKLMYYSFLIMISSVPLFALEVDDVVDKIAGEWILDLEKTKETNSKVADFLESTSNSPVKEQKFQKLLIKEDRYEMILENETIMKGAISFYVGEDNKVLLVLYRGKKSPSYLHVEFNMDNTITAYNWPAVWKLVYKKKVN